MDVRDRLQQHYELIKKTHILQHMRVDPKRFQRCSLQGTGLLFDFSKQLITEDTLVLLAEWAEQKALPAAMGALMLGQAVNTTEQTPALHTVLRDPTDAPLFVAGKNIKPGTQATLKKMQQWAGQLHQGAWCNVDGESFTDLLHLGVGGSYLGPALLHEAFATHSTAKLRCHFLANLSDPTPLLKTLNPKRTLLVVASKSFATQEMLTLASLCLVWLKSALTVEQAVEQSFAITEHSARALAFGLRPQHILTIPAGVGGRYSLWSAMSLSIVLTYGYKPFARLLAGAHALDQHALQQPPRNNLPMQHALLAVWDRKFCKVAHYAVMPYLAGLRLLPQYCQQLWMESLGKTVTTQDQSNAQAGPLLWGELGVLSQHSVAQWLHQGSDVSQVEFILAAHDTLPVDLQQQLWAHCLSQASTLVTGKSLADVTAALTKQGLPSAQIKRLAPHQVLPGNRGSHVLVLDRWDPYHLGALLALHEHSVYLQSVLMGINAFDQFGVEWGKQLSRSLQTRLKQGVATTDYDPSTQGLLKYLQQHRKIVHPEKG